MEGPAPLAIDGFDEDVTYQEQMAAWAHRIRELSRWVHRHMEKALADATYAARPAVRSAVSATYKRWLADVMATMATGSEPRILKAKRARFTLHMHVFAELSRMQWLLRCDRLARERDLLRRFERSTLTCDDYEVLYSLERTTHPMWVDIMESHQTKAEEEPDESDLQAAEALERLRVMWKRPLLEYRASDVQALLLFLTQQANAVPSDAAAVAEFARVHELLWTRTAELLSQMQPEAVHDDPEMRVQAGELYGPSRLLLAFCTIYTLQLERRLFMHRLLSRARVRVPPVADLRERTFAWVEHMLETLPEDAFDTLMTEVADDGYRFPGDDAWFRFRWPERVHSRGACITALRPHLYRLYYSEDYVARRTVLLGAKRNHAHRLVVLRAVDQHLRLEAPAIRWCNGVQVDNDGIEMSAWKLHNAMSPMLVQVLSSYWAYYDGRVHVCDDLYESIAVWFWLLRVHHNDVLDGISIRGASEAAIGADAESSSDEELGFEI